MHNMLDPTAWRKPWAKDRQVGSFAAAAAVNNRREKVAVVGMGEPGLSFLLLWCAVNRWFKRGFLSLFHQN